MDHSNTELPAEAKIFAKQVWSDFEGAARIDQEKMGLIERYYYHKFRHYERVNAAITNYHIETNLMVQAETAVDDVLKIDEGRKALTTKLRLKKEMSRSDFMVALKVMAWLHDLGNIAELGESGELRWRTLPVRRYKHDNSERDGVEEVRVIASVAKDGEEKGKEIARYWLKQWEVDEDMKKVVDYLIECTKFDPEHDKLMADSQNNPCMMAVQFFDQVAQAGEYNDQAELMESTEGLFDEMRLEGKQVSQVFVQQIAPYFPVLRMLKMFPRTNVDTHIKDHRKRPVIARLLRIWPKIVSLQPDIFEGARAWRSTQQLTIGDWQKDPIYNISP